MVKLLAGKPAARESPAQKPWRSPVAYAGPDGLSARLRAAVASINGEWETNTILPGRLLSLADYAGSLSRFYTVFEPVEHWLAKFREWPALGIDIAEQSRAQHLLADLAALGFDAEGLQVLEIPRPASFAAALGALYVLERAALGGKFFLRQTEPRLGHDIAAATAFFGGAGRGAQLSWPAFKARLDIFGTKRPAAQGHVIAGAVETFRYFALALNLERR
jgi:heme oxygenase